MKATVIDLPLSMIDKSLCPSHSYAHFFLCCLNNHPVTKATYLQDPHDAYHVERVWPYGMFIFICKRIRKKKTV